MKKVFITGGAGFIGAHIIRKFINNGDKVIIYDAFKQYLTINPSENNFDLRQRLKDIWKDITVIRGDTLNKDFLRRSLVEIKPDIIIHTASLPLASEAIEHTEEALDSILMSTFNILEIMRDFTHKCRLVHLSSSMVYGDFCTDEIDEDHPKDPKDIYGAFKLATEIIVRAFGKRHNIDYSIVRPSAVYGPYDANKRVLYKFVRNALNGKPISIEGDGSLKLDFTYVEDAAEAIYKIALCSNCSGKAYNITRGEARSLKEAVEIILKYIPETKIEHKPLPAYIPKRGTLNIDRVMKDTGYKPEFSLEEGLKNYIEHLRNNNF
jgi:nucleoside-diphosphate-sugar epimerase